MATERHYSPLDRLLLQADTAMRTLLPFSGQPARPSPAIVQPDAELDESQTRHIAGLMRINHTGEVCAQALYQGQALTAKLPEVRKAMEHAAEEEVDHLAWCEQRIRQLAATRACSTRCSMACPSASAPLPAWSATRSVSASSQRPNTGMQARTSTLSNCPGG